MGPRPGRSLPVVLLAIHPGSAVFERFLALFVVLFVFDQDLLNFCDIVEDDIHAIERDLPLVGEVVAQGRQLLFVNGHDGVDGSFSDM